jgi:hypothetical protein
MTAFPRDWALRYAALAWRVFPVVAGDKRPMYRGWQRDATTDPELIERYWRREPAPSIGVVTGELFDVLDIEAAHIGVLSRWLTARDAVIPETPMARTGRGGVHLYFSADPALGGRDVYLDGRHIGELKSTGGLVVLPPSATVSPYTWLVPPFDTDLASAPAWLPELLVRPAGVSTARRPRVLSVDDAHRRLESLGRSVRHAAPGRRNAILYWAAHRALEAGVPARYTGLVLLEAATGAGLGEREAQATIRSAWQSHGTHG